MKNTTVPPTPETNLNRLRDTMNEFRARYTNDQLKKPTSLSTIEIGNFKHCKFYISNDQTRGMAFCLAYKDARQSKNNKELCASVGSMICDVTAGFRNSIEAALTGIGVKPLFVRLPSGAGEVPEMDCPSILAYFGCCILLLFKKSTDEENYETFMTSCISELREIAGCDPDADLDLPFDFQRAIAIRTMLGACSTLRSQAIQYLISASNLGDTGIGSVCQYLCKMLSWSEMRHFTLINDLLVKPQSPVLLDPRVSREVDDLNEACAAITAHPNPQFFMYLAPKLELLKADPSRFPTLIAVAQELERGNYSCSIVANSTARANLAAIYALVELHCEAMPQN